MAALKIMEHTVCRAIPKRVARLIRSLYYEIGDDPVFIYGNRREDSTLVMGYQPQ